MHELFGYVIQHSPVLSAGVKAVLLGQAQTLSVANKEMIVQGILSCEERMLEGAREFLASLETARKGPSS